MFADESDQFSKMVCVKRWAHKPVHIWFINMDYSRKVCWAWWRYTETIVTMVQICNIFAWRFYILPGKTEPVGFDIQLTELNQFNTKLSFYFGTLLDTPISKPTVGKKSIDTPSILFQHLAMFCSHVSCLLCWVLNYIRNWTWFKDCLNIQYNTEIS